MRIIFLDIDGVINTTSHIKNLKRQGEQFIFADFCPHACNNVNRLADSVPEQVGIVVTSTWRRNHDVDELAGFLEDNGITVKVLGVTPHIEGERAGWGNRQREIARWLKETKVTVNGMVILDDDIHDLKEWAVAGHLVWIRKDDGFANADYLAEAKRIIKLDIQ